MISSRVASTSTRIDHTSPSWICEHRLYDISCLDVLNQVIVCTSMGSGWDIPMMTYTPKWRVLRRTFSTKYSVASSLASFYEEHRRSSIVFLQHILNSPEKWADHIRL